MEILQEQSLGPLSGSSPNICYKQKAIPIDLFLPGEPLKGSFRRSRRPHSSKVFVIDGPCEGGQPE